ncbi:MAG: F0F1 ATP synthase subunit A [Coriobacteriia bacterium]|nr:F0F1 ATP synthase subunit A [Coriobacteriia bacterium]
MGPLSQLPEHLEELINELMNPAFIVGDSHFGLTNFVFYMIICAIILVVLVICVGRKLTLVPGNKFVHTVEYGYEFVRNDIGKGSIGKGFKKHIPFLATLFFFILIANFIGLVPGAKAATGSISIAWALAIISFIYFNYWGIKTKGGLTYLKEIAPAGLPKIMVPVIWFFEFLSLCLRALTLAFRLFGNMFAGHMVLGIFAILTSIFTTYAIQNAEYLIALPSFAWLFFLFAMYMLEVLVAFLQAYVFTTLSAVYIQLATSSH